MCVEHATPASQAYGVLVHELTHAWQSRGWPEVKDLTLIEGLALWAQYQALLACGAIFAAKEIELRGDPVYGLGFRIALEVERKVGFHRVKDELARVSVVRS